MKRILIISIIILFLSVAVFSQEKLVSRVKNTYKTAIESKASLYSPKTFEKGENLLNEAKQDIEKNKQAELVEKKLTQAYDYLKKSIEISKITSEHLFSLISSKKSAMKVNAHKLYSDRFNQGLAKFREAFIEAEKGDFKKAESIALEAEDIFNDIELEAIKHNIIGGAEKLYQQARQKMADYYAPKSFKNIKPLIDKANEILNQDRYNKKEAAEYARRAEYEANHAIYLATYIQSLVENEKTFEDLILKFENMLYDLAKKINSPVSFEKGFESAFKNLAESFNSLSKENKELRNEYLKFVNELVSILKLPPVSEEKINEDIKEEIISLIAMNKQYIKENMELRQQNYNLSEDLRKLREKKLTEMRQKLEELQAKLDTEQIKKEKYRKIETLFTTEEGNILRDGSKIVLRLYGINFPTGKSKISEKHHNILDKVITAIKEFPNSTVIIEGHTDSKGSIKMNNRLSQERADNVRDYIISNSGISAEKLKSIGYGQSRPIADNSTEEGRTKNRRIEIIIIPQI